MKNTCGHSPTHETMLAGWGCQYQRRLATKIARTSSVNTEGQESRMSVRRPSNEEHCCRLLAPMRELMSIRPRACVSCKSWGRQRDLTRRSHHPWVRSLPARTWHCRAWPAGGQHRSLHRAPEQRPHRRPGDAMELSFYVSDITILCYVRLAKYNEIRAYPIPQKQNTKVNAATHSLGWFSSILQVYSW